MERARAPEFMHETFRVPRPLTQPQLTLPAETAARLDTLTNRATVSIQTESIQKGADAVLMPIAAIELRHFVTTLATSARPAAPVRPMK